MGRALGDYRQRARILWPRLDPERLRRTRGDPLRILHLVEARSALPREVLLAMLLGVDVGQAAELPRGGTVQAGQPASTSGFTSPIRRSIVSMSYGAPISTITVENPTST